jgi:PAS domain-containing protein
VILINFFALNYKHKGLKQSKRFVQRLRIKQKSQPRSEEAIYRIVEITGFIARINDEDVSNFNSELKYQLQKQQQTCRCQPNDSFTEYSSNNSNSSSALTTSNARNLVSNQYSETSPNFIFKAFIQVVPNSPMNDLTLADANCDEYVSRLSLDGRLIYADHRISVVIGYSPAEVLGKSAYDYIIPNDHNISLFAHRLSMFAVAFRKQLIRLFLHLHLIN